MFVATGSAFGFILDVLCWVFIVCIVGFYLLFDTSASGEMVGLAITQVMSLTTMLQWGEHLRYILHFQIENKIH